MSFSILIKQSNQPRRVFAIHHVNNEDNISFAQIRFYPAPFLVREHSTKVVSHHAQIEPVPSIDFPLSVAQRREQTRSNV